MENSISRQTSPQIQDGFKESDNFDSILDDLIATPPKQPQFAPEEPGSPKPIQDVQCANLDISAALVAFADEHERIQQSFVLNFEEIPTVEMLIQRYIPTANLEQVNTWLLSKHKRKLKYRDIAVIWMAHRYNVTNNEDHSSPISGIIGLLKTAKIRLSNLHVSMMMKIFTAAMMHEVVTGPDHSISKATVYKLLI